MKLTLGQLRRLIREFGVDDTLRNDAGFFMAGGVSSGNRDREASLMGAPPGLGGPEDELKKEKAIKDAEEKPQAAVRVADRRGTPGGSTRPRRTGSGMPSGNAP